MMDIGDTIQAKSDQVNAVDLAVPVTVTIAGVEVVGGDQPVNIGLEEFPGRAYRPSKSMRRVLVKIWGPQSSTYAGRRLTLYNEPTVTWAGKAVGGIRISHASHIDGPVQMSLALAKGKLAPFTVQPLVEAQAAPAPPSPRQQMFDLLKAQDMSDKESILAYVTETLGRPVESSQELTDDDITTILTRLTTQES